MFAMFPDPRIIDVAPVTRYALTSSGYEQSITVYLCDGSEIWGIDEVWIATGYGWSVPFIHVLETANDRKDPLRLKPLTPATLNLSGIPSLHRFILYVANPTLAFISHVMCYTPFILADVASTWLTLDWQGEITYPTTLDGQLTFEQDL
jgi:hypothetical protein